MNASVGPKHSAFLVLKQAWEVAETPRAGLGRGYPAPNPAREYLSRIMSIHRHLVLEVYLTRVNDSRPSPRFVEGTSRCADLVSVNVARVAVVQRCPLLCRWKGNS